MRVKFPKDNKFTYGQDFGFWTGVPSGIEFEATECDNYYILRGKGYGTKDYGNGALFLYKKQSSPFDIKDFGVLKKDKEVTAQQLASRDVLIEKLVEGLGKLRELAQTGVIPEPLHPATYMTDSQWNSRRMVKIIEIANALVAEWEVTKTKESDK